jgi:hypothetical protein
LLREVLAAEGESAALGRRGHGARAGLGRDGEGKQKGKNNNKARLERVLSAGNGEAEGGRDDDAPGRDSAVVAMRCDARATRRECERWRWRRRWEEWKWKRDEAERGGERRRGRDRDDVKGRRATRTARRKQDGEGRWEGEGWRAMMRMRMRI